MHKHAHRVDAVTAQARQLHHPERQKILLTANLSWYLYNFRARLAEHLEAQGYEIVLAAPPDDSNNEAFFQRRAFYSLRAARNGLNPLVEALALLRILRVLRQARPGLVLSWATKPNIYMGLAGRLLGIPVVPNLTGMGQPFVRGGLLARFVGALYKQAFASSPTVFFQNDEDQRIFIDAGRVRATQAHRLPGSGVDLRRFQVQALPTEGPFVFLYVGRLLATKGVRDLVAAARMLRQGPVQRPFVLRQAGPEDTGDTSGIAQDEHDGWVAAGEIE